MAVAAPLRVIDTGQRSGRRNMAFDAALIEARREGLVADTIRFLRFHPCALLGRHQMLSHEIDRAACAAHGIEIGRRITGGGALYLDGGQIGWEIMVHRARFHGADLDAIARRLCEAAVVGLRRLGVPASYRPRNDIEVDGRKIGGTGGFFDGDYLFYQGTLLFTFDVERMLAVLKVPAAKLARHAAASAADRMTTLAAVLGGTPPTVEAAMQALATALAEGFATTAEWAAPSAVEEALADRLHAEEYGTDAFVESLDAPPDPGLYATAAIPHRGGTVRVDLRLEGVARARIREAFISGDFFVTPPRIIRDLEAALRGIERAQAADVAATFLAASDAGFIGLAAADLVATIAAAAA